MLTNQSSYKSHKLGTKYSALKTDHKPRRGQGGREQGPLHFLLTAYKFVYSDPSQFSNLLEVTRFWKKLLYLITLVLLQKDEVLE